MPLGENEERKSDSSRNNGYAHENHLLLTIKVRWVIQMAKTNDKYKWILDTYPETITKEQLYKLCRVSRKTAQHYLVNGIIPCVNTGKKTRQYTIRTVDVVAFLKKRDSDPEVCLAPLGWYSEKKVEYRSRVHSPAMQRKLTMALEAILESYPDVLTSFQVADVTGYAQQTIIRWCAKKKIEFFCIRRGYMIPKVCLMAYLTENRCRAINDAAKEHILLSAKEPSNV